MELSMSSRQSKEVKVTFAVTVGKTGISREGKKDICQIHSTFAMTT